MSLKKIENLRMNRREAIRGLGLTFGYAISAPAVASILESCSKKESSWNAVFLDEAQQHYVNHLVDIILPKSDTPGGLDINLPQFIDMMFDEMLTSEEQELIREGSLVFSRRFEDKFGTDISNSNKGDIDTLFATYFKLSKEEELKIRQRQGQDISTVEASEIEDYKLYHYLIQIRKLSLFGYFTSEKIGKEVLNFDPIPGQYEPCIPVAEVGNAWTIQR